MREQEYQALRSFIALERCAEHSNAGRLARAMEAELTPRQKELARMYYLDQMLMQDIADELGISVSSVSRTIKRGRARLRRYLRYGGAALLSSIDE